jgi:nucleoside-diphosphate-sugar epimerase
MKTVLVMGAAGFMGSHLVDHLVSKKKKVICFDRRSSKVHSKTKWFQGDIKDREAVFSAMSYCDQWVNLAGLLGTAEMIKNSSEAIAVNIQGAVNVFEAAKLYEKPGIQIAVGNYWMNNPYSITKSTAERLALMFNKEHKTKIRVLRGMNVYGPRQKHRPIRKVFPNLVIPALLNKTITVFGSGRQVMDLIYIKDIVEIMYRILQLNDSSQMMPADHVFEAGAGEETINGAVELILDLTGSKSLVDRVAMRPGETVDAVVTISKKGVAELQKYLKFGPDDFTPKEKAFQATIDWYREHIEEFPWDE